MRQRCAIVRTPSKKEQLEKQASDELSDREVATRLLALPAAIGNREKKESWCILQAIS